MKKNDILKSFVQKKGSVMFIIKRNDFKYFLSIAFIVFSILFSLRVFYVWVFITGEEKVNYIGRCVNLFLVFGLPYLLYNENYKWQKEQYLILNDLYPEREKGSIHPLHFSYKKGNRKEAKLIDLKDYSIISISLKNVNEIVLISEKKLPWGNRKIIISDEFIDKKEDILEFLKIWFLKK